MVDFLLLSAIAFGIWLVFGVGLSILVSAIAGDVGGAIGSIVLNVVARVVLGVVLLGYFTYLDANGGTLGKRILGVKVVGTEGSPPTVRDTGIRTAVLLLPFPVIALLSVIPLLGGLLFVLVGLPLLFGRLLIEAAVLVVSDDNQRLGDRAAGTLVVPDDAV